jgi:hypothetical protein
MFFAKSSQFLPKILYLNLLLLPFLGFTQKKDPWILKNDKDNVKVFYRKTTDIHEVKLTASIKTTVPGLVQLLSEVDLYPSWGYKVAYSKLLEKVSDTEMYYYSRIDFPWPLQDRDLIMHTKLTQDPVTKIVTATSTAAPDYLPVNKDLERIRVANTKWTIIGNLNGWTYVEYYIYSSPGGNIPDWAINLAIDVGPRETIKGIKKLIPAPKYQDAELDYIVK